MNNKELSKLKKLLGVGAKTAEPLSGHTFLGIGGPADLYFEAKTIDDFQKAILEARKLVIPVTILGHGSNILVSDNGIRGLVIVNKSSEIRILDKSSAESKKDESVARWESDSKKGTFKYEFKDLDYDETAKPRVRVCMDSGVDLPYALDYLINKGITGLQWFAGIPGTIGGAVFNNIHGGTHFMSEVLESVKVIGKDNLVSDITIKDLGADYDKSRFQESGEIILEATYKLFLGDAEKAKYVASEWAKRKSIQPRNTPGCAFHNLTQKQKEKLDIPTTSAGYVIEHMLEMSGYNVGDAAISKDHHNFIVNKGKAKAADYLAVMHEIYNRANKEFGIEMVPEIFFMGFSDQELGDFKRPEMIDIRKTRNREVRTVYIDSKKLFSSGDTQ